MVAAHERARTVRRQVQEPTNKIKTQPPTQSPARKFVVRPPSVRRATPIQTSSDLACQAKALRRRFPFATGEVAARRTSSRKGRPVRRPSGEADFGRTIGRLAAQRLAPGPRLWGRPPLAKPAASRHVLRGLGGSGSAQIWRPAPDVTAGQPLAIFWAARRFAPRCPPGFAAWRHRGRLLVQAMEREGAEHLGCRATWGPSGVCPKSRR